MFVRRADVPVEQLEPGVTRQILGHDPHLMLVRVTFAAGDCFFVPPGVPHGVVAREEGSLLDTFTPAREDFLASL